VTDSLFNFIKNLCNFQQFRLVEVNFFCDAVSVLPDELHFSFNSRTDEETISNEDFSLESFGAPKNSPTQLLE
jgi:hypothetical protein